MEFDLFKLHSPEDKTPKSWICVSGSGLKEKLNTIVDEIKVSSNVSKSHIFRILAKELGCPFSNVKRRIYCRNTFPLIIILNLLNLWKNNLHKSEEEFISEKKKIQDTFAYFKCNSSPAKFVKAVKFLSPTLAKINGAHAADGWMTARKRKNGFVTYDYALREECKIAVLAFQKWASDEFEFTTKVNDRAQGCYSIEFVNKIFVRYLHIFFGFPYGKKSQIVKEPEVIKNADFVFRKAFALGVMTFDGAVCKNKCIELVTKSKCLRDSIFEILMLDGIKNIKAVDHPDKFDRWLFYSSRSIKNPDFIKWLSYFEKDTNKYNRILSVIDNHKCYTKPI